jgi:predicted phage tail protein
MKTIRLLGDLEKFKPVWTLDVQTPAEALRAISVQRDGFLAECDAGHYVAVLVDINNHDRCRQVTGENALDPWADEELWIVPSASGETGIEIGAAVAAAIGATGATAIAVAAVVNIAVSLAISLALSSVANLITGKKKNTPATQQERPENKPSFIADGVVNLTAAGHPHPILFGEVPDTGCMILSSDYWVEDIPV